MSSIKKKKKRNLYEIRRIDQFDNVNKLNWIKFYNRD
jgi:hypothetical protein